jgi:hypothetical protein
MIGNPEMVGICVIPGAGTGPLPNRPGGIASLILLLKWNPDPEIGAPLAPIPASGFAVLGGRDRTDEAQSQTNSRGGSRSDRAPHEPPPDFLIIITGEPGS